MERDEKALFVSKGASKGPYGQGLSLNKNELLFRYNQHREIHQRIINDLIARIENAFLSLDFSPIVKGRIKSFASYYKKYKKYLSIHGKKSVIPPINDFMGIRIICPFKEDVEKAKKIIGKNFNIEEVERKGHTSYLEGRDTFREFGYESTHLLIRIPQDIIQLHGEPGSYIAEIQIRTIMQDAWAEIEHELFYKTETTPLFDKMQRKLAAVSASFFLADSIFDEIRKYQRKLVRQLDKRRGTFFKKIEESTDGILFSGETPDETNAGPQTAVDQDDSDISSIDDASIDTLLLNALTFHNKGLYKEAVALYSKILDFNPNDTICALIYNHRGMAHFACSMYEKAIEDFTNALKTDKNSSKAAYYRGVVNAVLKNYLQAIDDFSLSLSLHPYQSFCIFRRGQAYYHTGDYMQALADCEASLAMEPQNEAAQKFRELLQKKLQES